MEKLKIRIADFFGTIILWLMMALDDIIDLAVTAVVTILVCFVLTNFFFMPVRVDGTSMYPTIENKSVGFSSIITRRVKEIERFDIVIIRINDQKENLVKRVVGLPGETIWYVNDTLYVNGTPVSEDFFDVVYVQQQKNKWNREDFTANTDVITLGEDEYYCLGDNRIVSIDSRSYGPFKADQIMAKGIFVLWPFDHLGSPEN
ncbi:MAG: signal peptidase I [Erysipelotrichaceae bacterium]|nr:signal peptidase I [Erysipelotrichaceae bacterium]